ncbi:hypothetical protein FQN57_000195 [Myotisia sp. PD_48]|nr:hypothetical protein FQN57_000195 [Myotisia sp. PD_48]
MNSAPAFNPITFVQDRVRAHRGDAHGPNGDQPEPTPLCVLCGVLIEEWRAIFSQIDEPPEICERRKANIDRIRHEMKSSRPNFSFMEDDSFSGYVQLSYDSSIVGQGETRLWLSDVYFLYGSDRINDLENNNDEAMKFFLARGYYDEDNDICIDAPDGTPIYNVLDHCDGSYYPHSILHAHLYPFHQACYEILCKILAAKFGIQKPDPKALHHTLDDMNYARLAFAYGKILGQEFSWICYPGEEHVVADPIWPTPVTEDIVIQTAFIKFLTREHAANKARPDPPPISDLSQKVKRDPFDQLGYDILYEISSFLSRESARDLIRASPAVLCAASSDRFWLQRIRLDMPWYWELDDILEAFRKIDLEISYRMFYFWLDKATLPTYGMTGLLNYANRRRIWAACERFAAHYHYIAHSLSLPPESEDE